MISNRTRPLDLRTCPKCEKQHPATLFNAQGFCVYCAQAKAAEEATQKAEKRVETLADDPLKARRREHLRIRREKQAALARIKAQEAEREARNAELDAAEAARQELARRELCRNHLLPFILRFNDKYEAGWVHKDICDKLEWFSAQVAAGLGPRMMIFMPPRHGKLLADSTPILTVDGWKTHGELRVGDQVFHPSGRPVRVVALSEKAPADWLVETTSGETVRCHENHEWTIYDRTDGKWKTVPTSWFVRRTKFGKQVKLASGARAKYQLPEVEALQFPEAGLPMHPYVLGAWLGDGSRGKGCLTHAECDRPVVERVEREGYNLSSTCVQATTGVVTSYFSGPRPGVAGRMFRELREIGVLDEKFIPEIYLRGSTKQRLQLLAGLVDTDGHTDRNGRMRFTTADRRLADGVMELCAGLGFRPYLRVEQPRLSSSGVQGRKEYYVVGFQPTVDIPCALERKRPKRLAPQRRIAIKAVTYAPAGEQGHCIQVDSPDGLYLAGRGLVPTHNSEIGSRSFPAWHLGRYPHHEFIACSYGSDLANGFSRKVRDVIEDPAYHGVFEDCRVSRDSRAVESWQTTKGGGYTAAGVGGPITGRGAHVLVIDDPIKNREDAESAQKREAVWDWYTSTAYTRLAPGGGILVILTRWHDDDLAGRLLRKMAEGEGDEWVVVEYPAQAVTDELFRKKGEPLHPERYSNEALEQIKRAVGPRDWQALYQQNPTPDEGDYFNKSMFQWYTAQDIPDYSEMNFYTAWDLAIGQNEQNDFSVGITVGVDRHDRTYVVDIQRGHWGTLELVDKMLEVYKTWRPAITGIEKGHIEMTLRPFLDKRIREERLTSFYIEEMNPGRRDKVARARSIQGRMQQGLVYFRKHCNVTAQLVAEMMRFPNGVHDDGVDAMAWIGQMLSLLVRPREQKAPRKQSWKDKLARIARVHQAGRKNHMSA